jgi:hypothetical protein
VGPGRPSRTRRSGSWTDARSNEITFRFGFQFEILRGPSFRMFRME